MVAGIYLPFSPLARVLGFTALPGKYFVFLGVVTASYLLVVEAAKRRLASQIFDIVVSDICMPDMDGVELLRYSKEVSPSTTFLLITGVPTIDTAIDAVNYGADRYVVKGDRLLALTADAAVIETRSGSRLTFPRKIRPAGKCRSAGV